MSDAKICDRCGNRASSNGLLSGRNWSLKYKSMHKPSTFIGARNRKLDLCGNCRRELDKFLGLGTQPHDIEGEG